MTAFVSQRIPVKRKMQNNPRVDPSQNNRWTHHPRHSSFLDANAIHATITGSALRMSEVNIASLVDATMTSPAAVSTAAAATTTTFEPVLPDTSLLLGFGAIVVVSIISAWVWANQVVPVSRTKLALSKKNGPVRDYLDDLRAAAPVEKNDEAAAEVLLSSTNATVDTTTEGEAAMATATATTTSETDSRDFERWLFTDWLEKDATRRAGRQKEAALPILKDAKWNSGDNPVLAASALIMAGVLFSAVTERVFTT